MSEFEKRFPKPEVEYKDESHNFISTMNILYDKKREGWLEALKWMCELKWDNGESIAFLLMKKEIEELDNEKTT